MADSACNDRLGTGRPILTVRFILAGILTFKLCTRNRRRDLSVEWCVLQVIVQGSSR